MTAPTVIQITQHLVRVRQALGLQPCAMANRVRILGRPLPLGMAELQCELLLAQTQAANDEHQPLTAA